MILVRTPLQEITYVSRVYVFCDHELFRNYVLLHENVQIYVIYDFRAMYI